MPKLSLLSNTDAVKPNVPTPYYGLLSEFKLLLDICKKASAAFGYLATTARSGEDKAEFQRRYELSQGAINRYHLYGRQWMTTVCGFDANGTMFDELSVVQDSSTDVPIFSDDTVALQLNGVTIADKVSVGHAEAIISACANHSSLLNALKGMVAAFTDDTSNVRKVEALDLALISIDRCTQPAGEKEEWPIPF